MKMRFPGKCIECGEAIAVGQAGMWLKGTGVKHERCGAAAGSGDVRSGGGGGELRCLVCGKPAGCPTCEFSDSCDTAAVSRLCMCYDCMGDKDTYALYRAAASRKFPGLEPKAVEHASDGDWGGGDAAGGVAAKGRAGGRGASAAGVARAGGRDAGGPRGVSAGGQAKLVQGELREVDVDGGGARARKRRGSASGQQRL